MSNVVDLPPNKKSGLYKAPSHADGGVQVIVDNTRKVEVEGDEYHLCKKSLEGDKQYEFKGKTHKEILEAIFRDNHCVFEQGKAKSGDFIICKLVVRDKTKRDMYGSAKDIINALQSEKSCRVTDDAADTYNNRLGGKLADEKSQLIDLLNDAIKENPNDEDLKGYLELIEETNFEDGGSLKENVNVVEVDMEEKPIEVKRELIGIFNTDYSNLYFSNKQNGFTYPKVNIIDRNDVLNYSEPLTNPIVIVFNEKESITPDFIQLNEIKFAVIPDTMVNDIKSIFDKNGVVFVTYDSKSNDLKEVKLNALKSLLN